MGRHDATSHIAPRRGRDMRWGRCGAASRRSRRFALSVGGRTRLAAHALRWRSWFRGWNSCRGAGSERRTIHTSEDIHLLVRVWSLGGRSVSRRRGGCRYLARSCRAQRNPGGLLRVGSARCRSVRRFLLPTSFLIRRAEKGKFYQRRNGGKRGGQVQLLTISRGIGSNWTCPRLSPPIA
jgi:hypothetical protein